MIAYLPYSYEHEEYEEESVDYDSDIKLGITAEGISETRTAPKTRNGDLHRRKKEENGI